MAEVFVEQINHEIEERGCAAAGDDVSLVYNQVAVLKVNAWETAPELVCEEPVRRRSPPIQHARGPEHEGSGAQAGNVGSLPERLLDPLDVDLVLAQGPAEVFVDRRHHNQIWS